MLHNGEVLLLMAMLICLPCLSFLMKQLSQGAEGTLFLDKDTVVKQRTRKSYRLAELDDRLRGFRTRREAKVLSKLMAMGFPAPRLVSCDGKETIVMERIEGETVRDALETGDAASLCRTMGKSIALLHNHSIIHADLTTSNMILREGIVYFIDFGLSFFSHRIEDKAVDLHLLRQALGSRHYRIGKECADAVLSAYEQEAKDGAAVLQRLEAVERRGRYKQKQGS